MSLKRYAYTDDRKRKDARLFIRRMREFHSYSCLRRAIISMAKTVGQHPTAKYKDGRPKTQVLYACAKCQGKFREELVEIDHIVEMGALANIKNWKWDHPDALLQFTQTYLSEFLKFQNHQVLCRSCHKLKTYKMDKLWDD